MGTLDVTGGKLSNLSLRDSYAVDDLNVDHPVPPQPLIDHMGIGVLLMRDVNWWPDFPTTAQTAMTMWQADQGQAVDGVIAIDQEGMRLLLEGLGPIAVEGEAAPVAAGSLISLLQQRWGTIPADVGDKYQWWLGRKDFFGLLAKGAIARLQGGMGAGDAARLARSLKTAIDGKHIQVYAGDPALRLLLAQAGVDGAVQPARGDYLMVVDTNMGFNKANPRIAERLDYSVDLSGDGRARAALSATYAHQGKLVPAQCIQAPEYGTTYADMIERCYWDYVRVYAPLGSTAVLRADMPDVDVAQDGDKETFAAFFVVAPQQTKTVRFDYLLPAGVVEREGKTLTYRLLVQKQAGTAAMPVQMTLTLPPGAQLTAADPAPAGAADGKVVIRSHTGSRSGAHGNLCPLDGRILRLPAASSRWPPSSACSRCSSCSVWQPRRGLRRPACVRPYRKRRRPGPGAAPTHLSARRRPRPHAGPTFTATATYIPGQPTPSPMPPQPTATPVPGQPAPSETPAPGQPTAAAATPTLRPGQPQSCRGHADAQARPGNAAARRHTLADSRPHGSGPGDGHADHAADASAAHRPGARPARL